MDLSYAFYRRLVEPVASQLRASHVIVVPDGVLSLVPFDALLTEPPRDGAPYHELPYLVRTRSSTSFARRSRV